MNSSRCSTAATTRYCTLKQQIHPNMVTESQRAATNRLESLKIFIGHCMRIQYLISSTHPVEGKRKRNQKKKHSRTIFERRVMITCTRSGYTPSHLAAITAVSYTIRMNGLVLPHCINETYWPHRLHPLRRCKHGASRPCGEKR